MLRRSHTLRNFGIIVTLFGCVALAQHYADKSKVELPPGPVVTFPVPVLRATNLGLNSATASLLWMNAILEIGTFHIGYNGLTDDVHSIVTLDERFAYPYAFSALMVGLLDPTHKDEALAIARLGVERNIPDYRIPFYLAMAYHMAKDKEKALEYFSIAAKMPDLPESMRPTVINYGTHGSTREDTKAIWISIYETTKDDYLRAQAEANIGHIAILDALDEAIRTYHGNEGIYPKDVQTLVAAHLIRGMPRDPFGFTYEIEPDGKLIQKLP